jgi:hypothetical protein
MKPEHIETYLCENEEMNCVKERVLPFRVEVKEGFINIFGLY